METEEGQIYSFSKDRKSISVNGKWFRNYVPLKEDILKNINYKITYTTKKVDDKIFNNIKSIVALEIPKINPKLITKENLNNDTLLKKTIPNQTENTCLMCACNIICKEIESGDFSYTPEELTSKIQKLSKDFIKAYNSLS